MNPVRKQKSPSRRGWWWKVPVGLTAVLLIALAAVLLYIDPISHALINRTLNRSLQAGGALNQIDIRLREGIIEMAGLSLYTPEGFGSDPLLTMGALRLDIDPKALLDGELVVEELIVEELSLVLVRDKDGRLSPFHLLPPSGIEPEAAEANGETADQGQTTIPPIRFDRIRLKTISLLLIDHVAGKNWKARGVIDLTADDLQIENVLNHEILLGRLSLAVNDVSIDQPKGFSPAPLLRLGSCKIAASGMDMGSSMLPVDRLSIDKLEVSVERNAAGVTNLQQLADAWGGKASEGGEPSRAEISAATAAGGAAAPRIVLPTLSMRRVELNSLAFQFLDEMNGTPWRAGFDRLDMGITDLTAGDPTRKAVSLGSFALDLTGLSVDQLPGYRPAPLAGLGQFSVRTDQLDLASQQLVIQSITVAEPTAVIAVDADGTSNLQKLKTALVGETKPEDDPVAPSKTDRTAAESATQPPAILVEQIQVADGSFTYHHQAISKGGLALPLSKAGLSATNLNLFGGNEETEPASVTASFQINQPGQLPAAHFGAEAVVGPIGTVPPVNAQVRLVGFKLDTLGSLVPPATRTALGATGLDASAALAMDHRAINLFAAIETDHGVEYEALGVHGSVDKPTIVLADVLSGAFDRISDGLFNLGGDALGAGVSIAKGGVSVLGEVGEGGWNLAKNLAVSTFEIAEGAVTLDREGLNKGLKDATRESLTIAAGSVKDAGSAAGHGLGDSVSDLRGEDRVQAWDRQIPGRYQAAMQQAREALAKMPYPPAVE